jgi:outer membrane protein OmpA-like peptidoglycan-associated protein
LAKSSIDGAFAASARAALDAGGSASVSAESDWGRVLLKGPAHLEAAALAAAQRSDLRDEMHSVRYEAMAAPADSAAAPPPAPAADPAASQALDSAPRAADLASAASAVSAPPEAAAASAPAPVADAADLQARLTALLGTTTIQFDTASALVRAESLPKLAAAAELIRQLPAAQVMVEGHTDAQRVGMGNRRLSERRAAAVRDHLIGLGVPPAQLLARGFGVDRPLMSNDTAEGRAANRRISFTVQGG